MRRFDLSLSITLPAFNEESTLELVVEEARSAAQKLVRDHEVVIIDDGSTDATPRLADALAARHDDVRVVHHRRNRGFSGAMQSCVASASKDYVLLAPSDGQARFSDMVPFLEAAAESDFVFSFRTRRQDPLYRKLASGVWYAYLRVLFGCPMPQFSNLFLFRCSALREVEVAVRPDASNFLPVLYLNAIRGGYRVELVGAPQYPRVGGTPKGGSVRTALRTMAEDLHLWWGLRSQRSRTP